MKDIPTRYDHTQESDLYNKWEKSGAFRPSETGERYSIVMPPPNVTGNLHLGHVLVYAIHDVIARFKRRLGYSVMMLPGADHAAIAVEALVVKKILKEKGIGRNELGREDFLKEVWTWIEHYMPQIKDSFKRLGVSCDWERWRFTMDERSQDAVQTAFVDLYKQGLIYRGEYLVNWDVKLQTAVSDDEVSYQEVPGHLYWIKYGPVTVATTRPETKLGDTAIAVHPNDHRYSPYVGHEIEFVNETGAKQHLPVIADEIVDPEFGTGALKVTPSHDHVDWQLGKKHKLAFKQVIDVYGRMTDATGPYKGMKVEEARSKIVQDLESRGLLEKTTDYPLRQPVSQRSNAVIEPLPSTQWFLKTTALKQKAEKVVKSGEIKFYPKSVEKIYFHWLENLHDWCISRQLWWGHQLPVWYCQNPAAITKSQLSSINQPENWKLKTENSSVENYIVGAKKPSPCPLCGKCDMKQDVDVLDTWFSSGIWPFSTLGWPNEESLDLKKYFPTDLLITAQDILFFWVARMIMMSEALKQQIPFKDVYFHGLILDEKGQKMSKSKGNATDPLELLDKYGADALRMSVLGGLGMGQDQRFSQQKILKYRNFVTKVWNASRFVASSCEGAQEKIETKPDHNEQEFLKKLSQLEEKNQKLLSAYQLGLALEQIYDFFWHTFADQFLEYEKKVIGEASDKERVLQAKTLLLNALKRQITLLEDFAPFVCAQIKAQVLTK
jgi:valyl-tRNA synthetase